METKYIIIEDYNIFESLNIIENKKGYFTLEDVQEVFNLDKKDSKTTINSFWKARIFYKIRDYSMPNRFVINPNIKGLQV